MAVLSGFFGTFVLGTAGGGASGIGTLLHPIASTVFAVPLGGTLSLTLIAASI